jgi:hypothetical protein
MTFQSLQQNKSGPSPASQLHSRYNLLTNGRSKVSDWKLLLERGYSFDELYSLLCWLEFHRAAALPSSTTIVRNAKEMIAESKTDPVACRVPVTQEAMDMWEIICHAGCDIEPEYVQDALNKYRDYLACKPVVFDFLESPKEFIHDWFVLHARYGSPRMRRFHILHPKFINYIALVKRAMERG